MPNDATCTLRFNSYNLYMKTYYANEIVINERHCEIKY